MSMVINTNMSALNTTNQLNKNTSLMNSSLQKLSSGYSINNSADDSAGLAISEKMRGQIQGLDQASSNSQDATSLTQTADGALDETTTILKRMRELAVKASSDTLTDDDRTSIQDETNSLRQEVDRIANDTEYNTKKLINGNSGSTTAVSGTNSAAIDTKATVAGNNTDSGTYTVNYTSVATVATTGIGAAATSGIAATTDSATAYAGDLSINGTTVTIAAGDTIDGVLKKINAQTGTTGVTASMDTTTTGNEFIKLTDKTYGSASQITLAANSTTLNKLFNAVAANSDATSVTTKGTDATGTINGAAATAQGNTLSAFDLTVTGNDTNLAALNTTNQTASNLASSTAATAATDLASLVAKLAASAATTATADNAAATAYTAAVSGGVAATIATAKAALYTTAAASTDAASKTAGTTSTASNTAAASATAALAALGAVATADVNVDAKNALTFQVGANSDQTMRISIDNMDSNSLGVAGNTSTTGIDLTSAKNATDAITKIDAAIKKVSSERSNLGAVQNSLNHNVNNLKTESENLTSAESNIRDTDMASEMANYTKLSVVNQAATAMLAKANQQPSRVLTLLQQ